MEIVSIKTPSAEDQLLFLKNIQRILNEGIFTSSYKYALLHALADLSVIKGDDSGKSLELSSKDVASQFLSIYLRQTKPFPSTINEILKQNTGKQAAIINYILESKDDFSIPPQNRPRLISKIDNKIREMPIKFLQNVGNHTMDFLYDNTSENNYRVIVLKPGVVFCFRALYEFIISMIRQSWTDYIRRCNIKVIGENIDLKVFLFGAQRSKLKQLSQVLYDLQEGKCFYSEKKLKKDYEVDHFVPWSKYAVDLGNNFVLASAKVNQNKCDHIAAEEHLEKWVEFQLKYTSQLKEYFDQINFSHNLRSSFQIAKWAYSITYQAKAQVWKMEKTLCPITSRWQSILDRAFQNLYLDNR